MVFPQTVNHMSFHNLVREDKNNEALMESQKFFTNTHDDDKVF